MYFDFGRRFCFFFYGFLNGGIYEIYLFLFDLGGKLCFTVVINLVMVSFRVKITALGFALNVYVIWKCRLVL